MAINFKKIHGELLNSPLTDKELGIIDSVEKFIDEIIIEKYKGEDLHINSNIIDFDMETNLRKGYIDLPKIRKKLMREELVNRYTKAGWSFVESSYNDSVYTILKGKL